MSSDTGRGTGGDHDGGSHSRRDAVEWVRVLAGDRDAFGDLFRRHAAAVANHCFRRVGSWSTAEDLTSVVFLETWRRRRAVRLTSDGSLLPWLLGVATNVTRNSNRSLRRYRRMLQRLPPPPAVPDPAEEVAARVDAEQQMRHILATLEQLPPAQREVVALCVWAGLSYEKAAVALGVPAKTVRSRLGHAREQLRNQVGTTVRDGDVPSPARRNRQ